LFGEFAGAGDIGFLGSLVAGAEQDDEGIAALREIDAIAWPVIDAHFPDRSADRSGVAGVAALEPEQPLGDAKAALASRRFRSHFANSSVWRISVTG
jgi:hypothetical protein